MTRKNSSFIWKHCKKLSKTTIKCEYCEKIMTTGNAIKHLFRIHNVNDEEHLSKWKDNTYDSVWQYFSKEDGYIARCKFCRFTVRNAFEKTNIDNHLSLMHINIIIGLREEFISAGLLRDFTLEKNLAICRTCGFNARIYLGKDVFKSHLYEHRGENENLGREEGIEGISESGMVLQSVGETNIADPSSHDHISKYVIIYDVGFWQILQKCKEAQSQNTYFTYEQENLLRSYMDKDHNCSIIVQMKYEERIRNINKGGMVQESVNEANIAGPSSHDDSKRVIISDVAFWQQLENFKTGIQSTVIYNGTNVLRPFDINHNCTIVVTPKYKERTGDEITQREQEPVNKSNNAGPSSHDDIFVNVDNKDKIEVPQ